MAPAVFWGSLLVLIGLTIIINVVFRINIPIPRIIFAFVLIFLGIKLLLGKHISVLGHESQNIQTHVVTTDKNQHEYNVVFSKDSKDLRTISFASGEPVKVHINTVFGQCDVHVSNDIPLRITSNTAFASVNMPDGNSIVVGSTNYKNAAFDSTKPYIDLKLDIVFANVRLYFH